MNSRYPWMLTCLCVLGTLVLGSCAVGLRLTTPPGLENVNHIIIFAQENRSLDHYMGAMRQYWAQNNIVTDTRWAARHRAVLVATPSAPAAAKPTAPVLAKPSAPPAPTV